MSVKNSSAELVNVAIAAIIIRYKLDRPYGVLLLLGAVLDPFFYAAVVYFVLRTVFLLDDAERFYLLLIGFISFRWALSSIMGSSNFAEILARFSEVRTRPTRAAIMAVMGPPAIVFALSLSSAMAVVGVLQPESQSFAAGWWLPFVALIQAIWTVVIVLVLSRLRRLGILKHEIPIAVMASLLWIMSPAMYLFRDIPAGASKFLTSFNPVSHLLAAFHNAYWFGQNISLEVLPIAGVLGLLTVYILRPRAAHKGTAPDSEDIDSGGGWVRVQIGPAEDAAHAHNLGRFCSWRDRTVDFTGRDVMRLVIAAWPKRETVPDGGFNATARVIQAQSDVDRLFTDFLSVYPDWALDQLAVAAALAAPVNDIVLDGLLNRVSPDFLRELWPILEREAKRGRRITIVVDHDLETPVALNGDLLFQEDSGAQDGAVQLELNDLNASSEQDNSPVIVTGGASQVGRCLLERLSARGRPGIAIQNVEPIPPHDGVRIVEGNLAGNSLPRLEATGMVHIPAIWLLPENLPWLAHCGLKRLVCLSSTSILSKEESPSRYERDLASRLAAAEEQVLSECGKLGVDCAILRPTMIYGRGLDRNVSRAVKFIEKFGFYPAAVHADGLRQPVHADDLAAAAMAILDSDKAVRGIYDVGGQEVLPYDEMIGRLFDLLGRSRRIVRIPMLALLAGALGRITRRPEITGAMVKRMGEDLVADNARAHADFGYVGRDFLAGGLSDIRPQSVAGSGQDPHDKKDMKSHVR
ncbi:MAG: hypothetical protein HOJ06_19080 [Rhodospirillaceae bacterium]|jgi:nucleoside-diphosphate-sugar epimerase|nr:hypothetical protein [Rhodospirillaceae bacterium]